MHAINIVSRRTLLAVALAFAALSAHAAARQPFTAGAFQAAQAAGQPILVEIHASWCPTCKAQLPILNKLAAEKGFLKLVQFRVDFDTQKDAVKRFGARMQSTLVLFKGRKEVARSVGETNEGRIRAMLSKAF